MKRATPYKTAGILAILAVAGFIALVACSNQGEGERCDSLNGDDDCKTEQGLACYPKAQLNNSESDRCCPRDRSKATQPVCLTPVDIVGADAATPADTGPAITVDAGGTDADASQVTDAESDAPDGD